MSLPLKFRNTAKSNQSLPSLRHDKLLLRMSRKVQRLTRIAMCVCAEQIASLQFCEGYHECVHPLAFQAYASRRSNALHMAPYDDYVNDPNKWASSDIVTTDNWEDTLRQREVQSSWSTSTDISISPVNSSTANQLNENEIAQTDAIEGWIHALQSVSAGEVEYMANENDRADAARKMQEWGFTAEQIENALGVATTLNLEKDNGILDKFREATAKSGFGMYVDDIDLDLKAVESHAM